ncbi:MAG: dihydrolipoyl dehydrogenase [Rhodothermaceae bacterium]|nr:dihydrolipoyl dehydrogenase [Rhodothermaceae bacterium]MXZ18842.1 dihydrolipoyl dehydrogenase [Rhodothermaceae bacterium]MXZ58249.1 dihydrolipoyl dehydrogenase [Rhodothermaceae bacterium]MYB91198.1 dihydrolipoyl dehydrogenase [Rhodothermaceae bacterium]MYD67684.1 dihydrolipoyl dehydrogenase [Rhodothermaceae bacterium]
MSNTFDVIVVGTGPGGYETAIRATQLGFKTAVVEKNKLGGVCLNVGCIPTKALLKSAELVSYANNLSSYGLELEGTVRADFPKVIERSRTVAKKMNSGVQYLMKKNNIEVIFGHAKLTGSGALSVSPSVDMDGKKVGRARKLKAKHIILATGARAREIPPLPIDGEKIIDYKGAMLQETRPARLLIAGAGAIGVEFAYFYHHMGTEVHLVELQNRIVPIEDEDVSKQLARSFKKAGIKVSTGATVERVEDGKTLKVHLKTSRKKEVIEVDQVLSSVGITGNIEDLGLEDVGVETDGGFIKTDALSRTKIKGVYAIGDVAGPPWLAHKASHEGILCVENIAGKEVHALDKENIPGCTYCQPQIASVGYTEHAAREKGLDIKIGKFPFSASGKASAAGHTDGFVKVIYDAKYGELLGCHVIGHDATELIAEVVTARTLETTYHEILDAVHPHPTLSEAIMEATRDALGQSINI